MLRTYFFAAFSILASASSFANAGSPCDRIQMSGMYSSMNQETRDAIQSGGTVAVNPLKVTKTQSGYEVDLIEAVVPSRIGEVIGSYATISLKNADGNTYCVANLTRDAGTETDRVAMAPNGDLIFSRLDQTASDGSVVPSLILYKLNP